MKERPILFSGAMVRAILEGRKTMTRRVVKWRGKLANGDEFMTEDGNGDLHYTKDLCPYGVPGDRLWVRETWRFGGGGDKQYRADGEAPLRCKWKPSIFMPRTISRITLEVTAVRVERLHEITEEDAKMEGIEPTRTQPGHFNWKWYGQIGFQCHARMSFQSLWEMINGKESWDANPWVWVVEFRRVIK